MTSLHAFLVFWGWFTSTHNCQVFLPDSAGNGNHIVYGGNCIDAIHYAKAVHGIAVWQGATQGSAQF